MGHRLEKKMLLNIIFNKHIEIFKKDYRKGFKIIKCFLFIFMLLIVTNCQNEFPKNIPATELIYIPKSETWPSTDVAFINADGDNQILFSLPVNKFIKPSYSKNKDVIFFLSGKGKEAPMSGFPAYWNLETGKFKVCSDNFVYYEQIIDGNNPNNDFEVLIHDGVQISFFDLSNCQKGEILVDTSVNSPNEYVWGITYSFDNQQMIYGVVENYLNPNVNYKVMKLELNTQIESQIAEGINPTISPDGKSVAYVGVDGIYVIGSDGQNQRKISSIVIGGQNLITYHEYMAPVLSWSPNGKWLVYHQEEEELALLNIENIPLYKLRISDGYREKIITGGIYPCWR